MSLNGTGEQIRVFLQDERLLKQIAGTRQGRQKLHSMRQQFVDQQASQLAQLQFCNDAIEKLTAVLGEIEA